MAIQDQTQGGLGIRRLTEEERARIAAQQAQYQQQLAARQATEQQNFEQTQAVGLANQAGTPGAPMLPPAVVPPVIQPVDVPATTSVLPPTPAPATASPAFDVAASDQRIRDIAAQGRSELGAQPLNIAGLNAQLADRVRTQQAPASIPGVRGDYNLANTSTVDRAGQITSTLRQPDNIIEGGYGGFGVGGNQGLSAREFLTRAEAQDAATRARVGERRREIAADVERIGLRNATTRGSATERRAARQALATFEEQQRTQSTTRLQEAGATERAQLQAQAEQARAGIAGAAGVQAALARAAGAQQAAQISAGATTEAARLRAAGLQGAAQTTATSPQAQLAAARAQLIQEQLTLAQQAQQAGDVAGTQAALGVRQSQPQLIRDNINGLVIGYVDAQGQPVLYTPEQLAQQRAALQPTQE